VVGQQQIAVPFADDDQHQALRLLPVDGHDPTLLDAVARSHSRDLLSGLIHEYGAA
jgi:hypothetical protein